MAFWAAVGLAVPFAYASSFFAEGGAPVAEGCSGGGAGPAGLQSVWATESNTVGRDGFFVIRASGYAVSSEVALGALEVEVTNAGGTAVPGAVTLLHKNESTSTFSYGWLATDPLEAGQGLTARIAIRNADPPKTTQATLNVVDQEAVLTQPPLEFRDWETWIQDSGPMLECPRKFAPGDCLTLNQFGTELQRTESADLEVTVRDLKTTESLSHTFCSSPARPLLERNYDGINTCANVPDAYRDRWCARQEPAVEDGSCAAPGSAGTAGGTATAGTGGVPTAPPAAGASAAGTAGSAADAGNGSGGDETAAERDSRAVLTEAGCGCRVAPRGGQRDAWLTMSALGVFGLAWGRRRAMKDRMAR